MDDSNADQISYATADLAAEKLLRRKADDYPDPAESTVSTTWAGTLLSIERNGWYISHFRHACAYVFQSDPDLVQGRLR